jgi:hypothetical protein
MRRVSFHLAGGGTTTMTIGCSSFDSTNMSLREEVEVLQSTPVGRFTIDAIKVV